MLIRNCCPDNFFPPSVLFSGFKGICWDLFTSLMSLSLNFFLWDVSGHSSVYLLLNMFICEFVYAYVYI